MPRRLASLEVTGRHSGEPITLPVVIADWEGAEYLVSMLGEEANWVKNIRAANGVAKLHRGRTETVQLDEISVGERPPVIRRYAQVAPSGRSHLMLTGDATIEQCVEIAPRTPVFRISILPTS